MSESCPLRQRIILDVDKKVTEYIDKQPPLQRDILSKIRGFIRELVPTAEERMSYGVPSFRLDGKVVVYAAFKNHVGFYPEPAMIEKFSKELKGYKTSKGSIRFDLDKPIPFDLIEKMVRFKFAE